MRIGVLSLICALFIVLPHATAQQSWLNLDFETVAGGRTWAWTTYGPGYVFSLDQSRAASGAQSMRVRYVGVTESGSTFYQALPAAMLRGKHVRFRGAIRTAEITHQTAALWLHVNGASGVLTNDGWPDTGASGTTDWQYFTIDRDISPDATTIYVGGMLFGNGTAWFDDFSLEVDGVPIAQGPPPGEPTAAQLDWVSKSAIPVATPDAGNGFEDLAPVKALVGDARIVALGEGTHGTSEFFRMKHRMLEYLATEMGFTIFAIEANMPEAYRLNDYVLNGVGDPKKLLQGMYFWTWNTREVLDMILWMREFNRSGKGRVQFTGFDMQTGTVAAENVLAFLRDADPDQWLVALRKYSVASAVQTNWHRGASQSAESIQTAVDAAHAVLQQLTNARASYLASHSPAEVDWIIQNALVFEQATRIASEGSAYRDRAMAENATWILDQNPDAKMVIWAHNGHVARTSGAMGSYMAEKYGLSYLVFGQLFHEGSYNAVNNGVVANQAVPSFPGTAEYVFHSAGIPQFILDLRRASPDIPGSEWLFGTILYRSIGSVATDGFYFTSALTSMYDALIFFDHTTPSALLPFN